MLTKYWNDKQDIFYFIDLRGADSNLYRCFIGFFFRTLQGPGFMKYLDLYYEWLKAGKLPDRGLCFSVGVNNPSLNLFDDFGFGYWAFNGRPIVESAINKTDMPNVQYNFTPLRQNILLFMAAMNNEL